MYERFIQLIFLLGFCTLSLACGPQSMDTDTQGGTSGTALDTSSSSGSPVPTSTTSSLPTESGTAETGTDTLMSETSTTPTSTSTSADTETLTGTGTSTTGEDNPCDTNPQAPGCTACNARGEPQRLFGLTWNFAGLPGDPLGKEELRCIIPETGESELIASIPGLEWLSYGTYDAEAHILYVRGYAEAEQVQRLFSIDTITGELLANPPIETNLNWSGGLHARSGGELVTVTWNADTMVEELRSIDPKTGQSAFIGTVGKIEGIVVNAFTYDKEAERAFMVGYEEAESVHRLFIVDTINAGLVGEAPFVKNLAWTGGLHLRSDKQLVSVTTDGVVGTLFTISMDAETTEVASLPFTSLIGVSTYDDVKNQLIVIDDKLRLFQIDATSGEVVANPEMDKPPTPNTNYNWSGGLHFR